ncbi:DNA translocase FtsK [Ideonella livida]|uniref:DNA translocase FtsK n=1 Tax=Ideonella livida TaxID=2707176 RepID=A0A7C9PEE9_9BURK|nr:DNA translocase FtsK [Ideonella livida]NDY89675.1 DNA translocase FtsK [Ideonella livida]
MSRGSDVSFLPLPTPEELWRWGRALAWLAFCLAWALALASRHAGDPGFSTSGDGLTVRNWLGRPGALAADLSLVLLGLSAWWVALLACRRAFGHLAAALRTPAAPPVAATGARGGRAAPPAPPATEVQPAWRWWLGLVGLLMASTGLEWTRMYVLEAGLPGHAGGVLGYLLGPLSMQVLGFMGSGLLWIVLLVLALPAVFDFSWLRLAEGLGAWVEGLRERRVTHLEHVEDKRLGEEAVRERERELDQVQQQRQEQASVLPPILIEPPVLVVPKAERLQRDRQTELFEVDGTGRLPSIELLDPPPDRMEVITPESLELTSRLIEKKLADFGVQVRVVAAQPGPVITRYEIEPATGVKGAQIVGLAKDLARSLSLVSIRVVETIPGKNLMALELPNPRRQVIRLAEILGSQVYHDASSLLTIALGKDIVGAPVVADLARMPHCLVAGTTGSGKSVGINGMILSLLYKSDPSQVRLILIDPKMLEMSVYEGIGHLLCPVVTDMKQAANALNWCVAEMERRYKVMSKLGVRGLDGYNRKVDEAKVRGELIPNPFSLTPESPEPLDHLPHIVVVIDELADLMMVVGKKIEELIARLAQKARASGIHLILATQRPSVDVITGLIKANIPTRLSFQVSSKVDSRTILDQMGAEALLGMGDMLYLPAGSGMPTRVHGAFVGDDEVHRVVAALKALGGPNYVEGILEGGVLEGEGEGGGDGEGGLSGEADPLYDQAVAVVLQHRKVSISLVQRHLRIGYNRAARLVEQMEQSGLVSSMATNGNRELLVPKREE